MLETQGLAVFLQNEREEAKSLFQCDFYTKSSFFVKITNFQKKLFSILTSNTFDETSSKSPKSRQCTAFWTISSII